MKKLKVNRSNILSVLNESSDQIPHKAKNIEEESKITPVQNQLILPSGISNFNSRIFSLNQDKIDNIMHKKDLNVSDLGISIIKTKSKKEKSISSSMDSKQKQQNSSSSSHSISSDYQDEQTSTLISTNYPSIQLEETSKYESNFISNFDSESLRSTYTSDNSVNQVNKYLKKKFDKIVEANNAKIIAKVPLFYKLKDAKQNSIKVNTIELKDCETGQCTTFPLYDDIATGFDDTLSKTIHERNHDDDLPTDDEQIEHAKEDALSTLKEGLMMICNINQRSKIIQGSKNMRRNIGFEELLNKNFNLKK